MQGECKREGLKIPASYKNRKRECGGKDKRE